MRYVVQDWDGDSVSLSQVNVLVEFVLAVSAHGWSGPSSACQLEPSQNPVI